MAELKRRTLSFNNGKQLKLYGESIAISKSMEIGEGAAPNIFSLQEEQTGGRTNVRINNPNSLTLDEMHELADFNIQLWMDFKAAIRKYGVDSPKIFNRETAPATVKKTGLSNIKKETPAT